MKNSMNNIKSKNSYNNNTKKKFPKYQKKLHLN